MKTYQCACGNRIFFENSICTNCQRELGFLPDFLCLSSIEPSGLELFRPLAKGAQGNLYKKCKNYARQVVCNWMIPEKNPESFCLSCRLDETIPNLAIEKNQILWRSTEEAKRRLIYTLISLRLPLLNRHDDPQRGLSFRFLADGPSPENKVLTGHSNGIITLNIAEADDAEREKRRLTMNEPYRTLLGHFRHEIGHYYWDRLVGESKFLEPFRQVFGDERVDYDAALKKYYVSGAPADWQNSFISAYATAHPWEDWAETWAHYLHIQDTLEVALEFGVVRDHQLDLAAKKVSWFGLKSKTFKEKIEAWSDLSVALNSINRSMGLKDVYPFILTNAVISKLRFISEVIADQKSNDLKP